MKQTISPAAEVHTCEVCGHKSDTEVTEQETYDRTLKRDSTAFLCVDPRKCTILTTVCMYCKCYLGTKPGRGVSGVSHSICPECFNRHYGNVAFQSMMVGR